MATVTEKRVRPGDGSAAPNRDGLKRDRRRREFVSTAATLARVMCFAVVIAASLFVLGFVAFMVMA